MRERDLDEFGSLFKRSIIPTIEVEKIEIRDVVILLDFSDRVAGCIELGRALQKRFGCSVSSRFLLRDADRDFESDARDIIEKCGAPAPTIVGGDPATHIKRLTEEDKPSLIVAPAPLRAHERSEAAAVDGEFIDALLVATSIPTLLVREPVNAWPFQRILAKIPGGRHDLIEQFSFAFD